MRQAQGPTYLTAGGGCSAARGRGSRARPGYDGRRSGARRRRPGHADRRDAQRRRLAQPVRRDRGDVVRDVAARVRLPDHLLDQGPLARAVARDQLGHLGRRPDLDLPHDRQGEVVRRAAADRRGRRLHLQPDHRRRPRGSDLGRLPQPGHQGRGDRPDDPGADAQEAELQPARCCRSRSSRSTSGRTSPRRTSRPTPTSRRTGSPSSGRGRSAWSRAAPARSTYILEANPDYWGGAPTHRPGRLPGLQEPGPDDPGADQGRGRLRRRHQRAAGEVAGGPATGSPPQNGNAPSFDEIAFNTGAVDTKTGDPIGDGNPALQDTAFRHALGYAIDTQTDHRQGLPGRRRPRHA